MLPLRPNRRLIRAALWHCVFAACLLPSPVGAQPAATQANQGPDQGWQELRAAMLEAEQAGDFARAVELGRQGLRQAEATFGPDHPDTAAVAGMLAGSLHALGRAEEAEPLFQRALQTIERTLGPEHIEAMIPATRLGNFYLAENRFDLAEPLFLRALAISNARLGADNEQTLSLTNDIATIYAGRASLAEAEELLNRAVPLAGSALGADHALTLRMSGNVAAIRMMQGRLAEAEAGFGRVLEARRRVLGDGNADTLATMRDLATLYMAQGSLPEAEPMFETVLAGRERLLGSGHPQSLESVGDLGQLRLRQGRFADAERLHLRERDGYRAALGAEHPLTLEATNKLGKVYIEQGRYAEAEPLFLALAERISRGPGAGHPNSLLILSNLAGVYNAQGRLAEAEPLFRQVLAGLERALGPDHFETLQAKSNLGMLLVQQGRFGEAEPLLVAAVEATDGAQGADNSRSLLAVSNLAALYEQQNRTEEAVALHERAVAGAERTLGPDHPQTLLFVGNLGVVEQRAGLTDRAEALLRRVYEARERSLGPDHRDTLLAANNLGVLFAGLGRAEDEPWLRRVLDRSSRVLGANHPDTASTRFNLASVLTQAGRPDEAEPLFALALESSRDALGPDHPGTIGAAGMLAAVRMALNRRHADALAPARLFVAGSRARRAPADRSRFAEAQGRRETGLADGFLLLADALWAVDQDSGTDPARADEAFTALQDAAAGPTDRAVMQMAVRRLADRSAEGLGPLVRERDGLETQWLLANRRHAESLAATGDEAQAQRSTLRAERDRIAARLDSIDARLRREFPIFFDLVRPEALSLAATRAMLRADEALLLVVPGFRGTHVVAVTSDGAHWVRSGWTRDQVNAAVRRLLWDVGANVSVSEDQGAQWVEEGGAGYPYDRRTAHDLYRAIVGPVADALAGKRHVFIAAGGALSSLPFGILVAEEPGGADGDPAALRSTAWFADAHALVQLPSVQSLRFLRQYARPGEASSPATFLGFGDPLLQGTAEQRGAARGREGAGAARAIFSGRRTASGMPLADVRQLRTLARLPGTAVELEAMRAALGAPAGSVHLAGQATEAALRGMDLSGARVLAFATHGLVAGEIRSAAEPGLVFTPPQTPTEADDGLLAASEVAALRLDADWVILSACNTAAGSGAEGAPGLSGLARAFFYAGARTLLASHWPVRDDVAARLTVRTIEIARSDPGLSRAEAFQRAMREIREDGSHDSPDDSWAHPNAWAPFSLIGDGAE